MNKYAAESKRTQKQRRKRRSCENKRRYPTKESAVIKGQDVYQRGYCDGWHRSGSLTTLVAKVKYANRH